jgi:hypothetical protein
MSKVVGNKPLITGIVARSKSEIGRLGLAAARVAETPFSEER